MLTPFWFQVTDGLGYGVTASSQEEAEILLREFGYPRDSELIATVVPNISGSELEQNHVMPNAGPLVLRGVWFPKHNL